jgi:hypothetical protein
MSATITIAPMALLEAKLVQKLEEKKREGWTIDPMTAHDDKQCMCCLLGAQITRQEFVSHRGDYDVAAAQRLQISISNALELESGFMGHRGAGEYHQLGAKLRRQYVEGAA